MTGGDGARRVPTYAHAMDDFTWDQLWDLFDGDRDSLNIGWECLDRHRGEGTAIRLRQADGELTSLSFDELASWSSRFARLLEDLDVRAGDPVGVMIEPSLGFYAAIFGAIKRGAVAVPLFTLFGPEAVRARVEDCGAKLLVVGNDVSDHVYADLASLGVRVVVWDEDLKGVVAALPDDYEPNTRASDLAVLQYTSGTSRMLPDAVRHDHRSIVTLVLAARFGVGLAAGDRFFCPSSPAWGHGLWHGTIAPLSLGISTGAYAGRFDPAALVDALNVFEIDNLAAAGTVYRMLENADQLERMPRLKKASYTGEALSTETLDLLRRELGTPVCGMYGTTETGVILANFPGHSDYDVRPGALGKPLPGCDVAVLGDEGQEAPDGQVGEIAVRRRGRWFLSKDLGRRDEDGYFWYLGRADDVIISAGWTISPLEVENALRLHPAVTEVAVIGVPDAIRGQVLKAFIVSERRDDEIADELKELVRTRLSPHEYPRQLAFVAELPTTVNGKINRRALRQQELAQAGVTN